MLGTFNIHLDLWNKLRKTQKICQLFSDPINEKNDLPELSGLLIDWVPKTNPNFTKQAVIIENYTKKKIPIVLFDRYLSLSKKEDNWLRKFRVFFFEPAINYRRGFSYLPQWIEKPDFKYYSKDKNQREYDLAYKCDNLNNNLKNFEKYYFEYAKLYPDKNVVYSTNNINKHKEKQYKEFGLKRVFDFYFSQATFTIAIDTEKNYNIGYLDENVFEAMSKNCLPLLPTEHKYFNAMFSGLTLSVWSDVTYCIDMLGGTKEVIIEEIYGKIEKVYPEFMIDNVVEVIKNCFTK